MFFRHLIQIFGKCDILHIFQLLLTNILIVVQYFIVIMIIHRVTVIINSIVIIIVIHFTIVNINLTNIMIIRIIKFPLVLVTFNKRYFHAFLPHQFFVVCLISSFSFYYQNRYRLLCFSLYCVYLLPFSISIVPIIIIIVSIELSLSIS